MADLVHIQVQPTREITHYRTVVRLAERRWHFRFYTCVEVEPNEPPNPNGDVWHGPDGTSAAVGGGGWFFDLAAEDANVPILQGVGLTCGLDLLFPYRHLDIPPGPLWVLDNEGTGADPDLLGFADGRFALVYLEAEASEVEA